MRLTRRRRKALSFADACTGNSRIHDQGLGLPSRTPTYSKGESPISARRSFSDRNRTAAEFSLPVPSCCSSSLEAHLDLRSPTTVDGTNPIATWDITAGPGWRILPPARLQSRVQQ